MKAVTVKEIQKLDKNAIQKVGISSLVLMENAGRSIAQEILKRLKGQQKKVVCVVCGLGNNAGDGFVAARHLLSAGIKTKIFLIGRESDLKNDAAVNCQILKKAGVPIFSVMQWDGILKRNLSQADVVVDAIFGVGLNRDIEEPFKSIIVKINQAAKNIVSADVPSGLDGTTGEIYGVCVKADVTVTFSFAKKGFFKNEGPKHVGKIVVADIGIL